MKKIIIKTYTYIPKGSVVVYINKLPLNKEFYNGVQDGVYDNEENFLLGTINDSIESLRDSLLSFEMKRIEEPIQFGGDLIIDSNIEFNKERPACSIFNYKNKIRPGWIVILTPNLGSVTEDEYNIIKKAYDDEGVWFPEYLYNVQTPSKSKSILQNAIESYISEININKLYNNNVVYGYIPFTYPITRGTIDIRSICDINELKHGNTTSFDKTYNYLQSINVPISLSVIEDLNRINIQNMFVSVYPDKIIFKDKYNRLGILYKLEGTIVLPSYSMFRFESEDPK